MGTYQRPTICCSMRPSQPSFAAKALSRFDALVVQHHSHLAAKQFEQNGNALATAHAFKESNRVAKCPTNNAHLVARRKSRPMIELHKPVGILATFQSVY